MRRLFFLFLTIVCGITLVSAQERPLWEQPEVFAVNKLPHRATLVPYSSTEAAAERGVSEYVKYISG